MWCALSMQQGLQEAADPARPSVVTNCDTWSQIRSFRLSTLPGIWLIPRDCFPWIEMSE